MNNIHLHTKDNITNLSMIDIINEKIMLINNFNNITNLSQDNYSIIDKLIKLELNNISNILGENLIDKTSNIQKTIDNSYLAASFLNMEDNLKLEYTDDEYEKELMLRKYNNGAMGFNATKAMNKQYDALAHLISD